MAARSLGQLGERHRVSGSNDRHQECLAGVDGEAEVDVRELLDSFPVEPGVGFRGVAARAVANMIKSFRPMPGRDVASVTCRRRLAYLSRPSPWHIGSASCALSERHASAAP